MIDTEAVGFYRSSTEKELISLLRDGDRGVFAYIYQLYSPKIYTNLKRLLKDEEIAQEFLQDVFCKIWDKRAELNIHTSFHSYLYRISENLVKDFFRKAVRDQKLMQHLIEAASELYVNIEEMYIDKEDCTLLNKAIETLPPQRRKVFILCKLEGKSYDEVGELLGISNSTINDHIVRATKTIRTYFITSGELSIILIAAAIISEQI